MTLADAYLAEMECSVQMIIDLGARLMADTGTLDAKAVGLFGQEVATILKRVRKLMQPIADLETEDVEAIAAQ